jgi:hypothetical protein
MASVAWFTKKRIAILSVLAVVAVVGTWAAAPLFIETRAEQPTPTGFTVSVKQGTWRGVDSFHFAEGTAVILQNSDGEYLLRLQNFHVRNGPDIHFFLSGDATVGTGDIDLGTVPATMGNYNVPIPPGVDVDGVNFALVHCVPANFLFASAPLS